MTAAINKNTNDNSVALTEWLDNDLQQMLTNHEFASPATTYLDDTVTLDTSPSLPDLDAGSLDTSPSLPDLDSLSTQTSPATSLLASPRYEGRSLFPELGAADPLLGNTAGVNINDTFVWPIEQTDVASVMIQNLLTTAAIMEGKDIAKAKESAPKRSYTKRQRSESLVAEPPIKKVARFDPATEVDEEIAAKRRQNTLAARRSRARKVERMQTLESRIAQLTREKEALVAREREWMHEKKELLARLEAT